MTFGAFATLLVALGFAWLLLWVLRPANKDRFRSYASIPLDDDAPRPQHARRPGHDGNRRT